jgi:Zn-dependent protease with chaperone function
MALTQSQYAELVQRLEREARGAPGWYRLRVWALVVLGLVYIPLSIIVLLLLLVGAFTVLRTMPVYLLLLLIGAIIVQVGAAIRALRFRFPLPAGLELRREDAPALFAILDEVTARLQTPVIHRVLLVQEFNAAVTQRSAFGLLGAQRNYLLLGLPLLLAFSPEQMYGVLLHELGHLAGQHGRTSMYLYQVRLYWHNMMQYIQASEVKSQRRFGWMINGFYAWYIPVLDAYTFTLARQHEVEADLFAASLVGKETVAGELVAMSAVGCQLEQRHEALNAQMTAEPLPPLTFYSDLAMHLRAPLEPAAWTEGIRKALQENTGYGDPHLALRDRLALLEITPSADGVHPVFTLPAPPLRSAAEAYLGAAYPQWLARFNRIWWLRASMHWSHRHHARRQELAAPEVPVAELDAEALYKRTRLVYDLEGEDAALPLLQELIARDSHATEARFIVASILLKRGDDAGLLALNGVMEQDPEAALTACRMAVDYLLERRRTEEARAYEQWARDFTPVAQRAYEERNTFTKQDHFVAHDWPEDEVAPIAALLADVAKVRRAYLVRKEVKYFPQKPCFLLAIEPTWGSFHVSSTDGGKLANEVAAALTFPRECMIVVLADEARSLLPIVQAVPGALIYEREERR